LKERVRERECFIGERERDMRDREKTYAWERK